MRLLLLFALSVLAFATWAISLLHVTAQPLPHIRSSQKQISPSSQFLHRSTYGIHHLILHGTPYQRGLAEANFTRDIMQREEAVLFEEFERFFPNKPLRYLFILGAMRYFWGAEAYFSQHSREQMLGLSNAASPKFNHYIDPYTRQAVLHGIHEVGQMFVDVRREDLGCTAVALPNEGSWLIGRNFDFEMGRLFDEEKAVKWHFPDKGYPYVTVSWPGFVGSVTGVNKHGVYVSLNAAGSRDYRRYGTPTTLVATDILQFTQTAEEAVKRLRQADTFITDIFLIADQRHAYRVEKSPTRTKVISIHAAHAIANHLIHPDFANDSINQWRLENLTTRYRQERAQQLADTLSESASAMSAPMRRLAIQRILRDKAAIDDRPLHLANRRAIDALIASHSVVYDAKYGILYVSEGPALAGRYQGLDLAASFAGALPVKVAPLPADPTVTSEKFYDVKRALKLMSLASHALDHEHDGQCRAAARLLHEAENLFSDHSYYHLVRGRYLECIGDSQEAHKHWQTAMSMQPAYKQDRSELKRRLGVL